MVIRKRLLGKEISLDVNPAALGFTLGGLVLALLLAIYDLSLGEMGLSAGQILAAITGNAESPMHQLVVMNVRMPRIMAALFSGAALATSGAIFQSISRNPLGSPDIIGFSTGAACGAIIQIVYLDGSMVAVSLTAVVSGLVTALIVSGLSMFRRRGGGYRIILTGIGVSSTISAINNLMLVYGDITQVVSANLWLSGSLEGRLWVNVIPLMVGFCVLIPACLLCARTLTLAEMGDELATSLGGRVRRLRFLSVVLATLLCALATAAVGPIAFVSLAAPQIAQRLIRAKKLSLISSAIMGSLLLLVADVITRSLFSQFVVPIGRATALIGGAYLLWLLVKTAKRS